MEERSVGTLGAAYLKIKKKPMNDDLRSIHKLISTHRKNMAYDFNPNVGLFMAQGFICETNVAACEGAGTATGATKKTIISSDYGETLTEVAEWELGDDSFWQYSCAVFISDEEVRTEERDIYIGAFCKGVLESSAKTSLWGLVSVVSCFCSVNPALQSKRQTVAAATELNRKQCPRTTTARYIPLIRVL